MKNPSEKTIQEAIIDLYLNVKIRKQEDLDKFEQHSLEKEKEKLVKTNPLLILDYIKSSIEILINMKVQEKLQSTVQSRSSEELSDEEVNVYEKELRHLEAEIRGHIKIEHQLKLHTENMQTRIDELETYKEELKQKLKLLQDQQNKNRDTNDSEHTENLKNENQSLKQIIKSYEERNISITELEKKIREKQAKHDKELKELEIKYKEKIRQLNKRLKYDDSSKTLHTKDNTRVTDVTVDHNQLTDRVLNRNPSMAGITERKREEYNTNNFERKKDLSTKKLSENMKNIIEDLKAKKDCSFLAKKKTEKENNEDVSINVSNINNKYSSNEPNKKVHIRTDSQVKLNENSNTKLNLSKLNANKHTRNCSFDKSKQLTQNGNTNNKNIPNIKDLSSTQNYKSNNTQKLIPSQTMTPSMISGKSNTITPNYIPTGNVIVNQNAVPCFNNINIYTSNMNNFKTNEINLKQYIINKMNTKSKGKQNHSRTTSTTANH